jgi:hypothetical protein
MAYRADFSANEVQGVQEQRHQRIAKIAHGLFFLERQRWAIQPQANSRICVIRIIDSRPGVPKTRPAIAPTNC